MGEVINFDEARAKVICDFTGLLEGIKTPEQFIKFMLITQEIDITELRNQPDEDNATEYVLNQFCWYDIWPDSESLREKWVLALRAWAIEEFQK